MFYPFISFFATKLAAIFQAIPLSILRIHEDAEQIFDSLRAVSRYAQNAPIERIF